MFCLKDGVGLLPGVGGEPFGLEAEEGPSDPGRPSDGSTLGFFREHCALCTLGPANTSTFPT